MARTFRHPLYRARNARKRIYESGGTNGILSSRIICLSHDPYRCRHWFCMASDKVSPTELFSIHRVGEQAWTHPHGIDIPPPHFYSEFLRSNHCFYEQSSWL